MYGECDTSGACPRRSATRYKIHVVRSKSNESYEKKKRLYVYNIQTCIIYVYFFFIRALCINTLKKTFFVTKRFCPHEKWMSARRIRVCFRIHETRLLNFLHWPTSCFFSSFHVHTVTCTRLRPVNYMGCEKGRKKTRGITIVRIWTYAKLQLENSVFVTTIRVHRYTHMHIVYFITCNRVFSAGFHTVLEYFSSR